MGIRIAVITLAIQLSLFVMWNIYLKYNISPAVLETSNKTISIDEIPFPAVFICNMNRVKRSVFESLLRVDELRKFFIYDTCYDINQTDSMSEETRNKASKWEHYYDFLKMASHDCAEMIYYCRWGSKDRDCRELFKPVLTDKGLCCGFNIAHQIIDSGKGRATVDWSAEKYVNWTPEYQFKKSDPHSAIPRRSMPGFKNGLIVALDANYNEYHCSADDDVGFLVLLNNPVEIRQLSRYNLSIYPGTEVHMNVTPHVLEPSKSFAEKDPDERQCYFLDERKLRFYRVYTIYNCQLECHANYTIEVCGCLPKYIPVDFTIKICGKTEEICVSQTYDRVKCKCYSGCFEVNYEALAMIKKITSSLSVGTKYQNKGDRDPLNGMTILHIYYGNATYEKNTLIENPTYSVLSSFFTVTYSDGVIFIVIVMIEIVYNAYSGNIRRFLPFFH